MYRRLRPAVAAGAAGGPRWRTAGGAESGGAASGVQGASLEKKAEFGPVIRQRGLGPGGQPPRGTCSLGAAAGVLRTHFTSPAPAGSTAVLTSRWALELEG